MPLLVVTYTIRRMLLPREKRFRCCLALRTLLVSFVRSVKLIRRTLLRALGRSSSSATWRNLAINRANLTAESAHAPIRDIRAPDRCAQLARRGRKEIASPMGERASERAVSKTTYSRGCIGFYSAGKSSNLSGPGDCLRPPRLSPPPALVPP